MALFLIATPIGNPGDISLRSLETLKSVDTVIGEELKVTRRFLADHQVGRKELYQLNEHSTETEVNELAELCIEKDVALVSDCGTPGFCDPGSKLVRALRKQGEKIHSLPGASSLMYLLSLSSQRIDSFYFKGFLPAKTEDRKKSINQLAKLNEACFLLETPYRFQKLLEEFKQKLPNKKILIGVNLSTNEEIIWEGLAKDTPLKNFPKKAEPMVLIY